jgi:hypothetical protein
VAGYTCPEGEMSGLGWVTASGAGPSDGPPSDDFAGELLLHAAPMTVITAMVTIPREPKFRMPGVKQKPAAMTTARRDGRPRLSVTVTVRVIASDG